jgi:hypothetical protein
MAQNCWVLVSIFGVVIEPAPWIDGNENAPMVFHKFKTRSKVERFVVLKMFVFPEKCSCFLKSVRVSYNGSLQQLKVHLYFSTHLSHGS